MILAVSISFTDWIKVANNLNKNEQLWKHVTPSQRFHMMREYRSLKSDKRTFKAPTDPKSIAYREVLLTNWYNEFYKIDASKFTFDGTLKKLSNRVWQIFVDEVCNVANTSGIEDPYAVPQPEL